jgi:hypothetical protein
VGSVENLGSVENVESGECRESGDCGEFGECGEYGIGNAACVGSWRFAPIQNKTLSKSYCVLILNVRKARTSH